MANIFLYQRKLRQASDRGQAENPWEAVAAAAQKVLLVKMAWRPVRSVFQPLPFFDWGLSEAQASRILSHANLQVGVAKDTGYSRILSHANLQVGVAKATVP